MNKMAVFVEGCTEQLFVEKLVIEIAGRKNVQVELRKVRGGKTTRRRMPRVKPMGADVGQEYYVLIVDCGGDEAVKSRILEEYDNLARAGHRLVVGVRDVRPRINRAEIPEFRRRLPLKVKTQPIRVVFVLSIMELEAWFLSEYTHFSRLYVPISPAQVRAWLGFDPSTDDMECGTSHHWTCGLSTSSPERITRRTGIGFRGRLTAWITPRSSWSFLHAMPI